MNSDLKKVKRKAGQAARAGEFEAYVQTYLKRKLDEPLQMEPKISQPGFRKAEKGRVGSAGVKTVNKNHEAREDGRQYQSPNHPSVNARFLLCLLLERKNRDAALGDALEHYRTDVKLFGKKRADFLFYREIFLAACICARRIVGKMTGLSAIADWVGRHIS